MRWNLEGKSVVVTGGTRGIGKGIATAFAEAGAKVLISSRKADACEQAAAEIGHGCEWVAANVGDEGAAEQVLDAAVERFGSLDVLVNNAATNPYAGPMIDIDRGRWAKTLDVNVSAPLFWTQAAVARGLKDGAGGTVINIASVGGFSTNEMIGAYNVSKAALIHITKQLAAELSPEVRVNCLAPGLIKTDFARALWEGDAGDKVANAYPLKRLGEPSDIADAAVFLAREATWMTGQTLVFDGGGQVSFLGLG